MSNISLKILRKTFGYENFRGKQEEVIRHVSAGGDALVLMPTGGGKSLCYQIPSMWREGMGIVISPLIALMQDQVTALKQNGVRAAFLNSSLNAKQAGQVKRQIAEGELDLLYAAPERIVMDSFLELLSNTEIALIAIDEAHCVSQWGHDFRPEYLKLNVLHEHFPDVPRIALTATADAITRQEILERLQFKKALISVSGFDRPNIKYSVQPKETERKQLLNFLLNEHPNDSGIVYCLSRKRTEQTAAWLNTQGFNALPYHAGLPSETRQEHQDRFLREDGLIIVATIAFGMGIDKPDVRFVVHLDLPKSMEAYYQETGRAGRDGKPSDAWMVYGLGDVVFLKRLLAESDADENHKRIESIKLNSLIAYCESAECRRKLLLNYFDDEYEPPCNNCDSCLEPQEVWDGTVEAQKALSAVYRTGQQFGTGYLVDILIGKETERNIQFRHVNLKTFGCGKDRTKQQWSSIFRQLTAGGYVDVDVAGYGGLKLNDRSWDILNKKGTVNFRKDPVLARKPKEKKKKAKGKKPTDFPNTPENNQLWDELRAKRMEIAQEKGVPPFVIFHDSSLVDMVVKRPTSIDEFSEVSGVGEAKLKRYGKEFLTVLQGEYQ